MTHPSSQSHFNLTSAPGHLIRVAQQRHQTLWTQIVGRELTSVQFAILTLLRDEPSLDQRSLAERASTDTSTLADVCRRLAERGLLRRTRDADDTRRYVLSVTDSGAALLGRLTPDVVRVGEALLEGFDASERSALLGLLARLI